MKLIPFIARRYLFSGQHKALVSVITIISMGGVAVGVFALIVVLAIMEGFTANLLQKFIGAYAHIEIQSRDARHQPLDAAAVLETVRRIPDVKSAGPMIRRMALVEVLGAGDDNRKTGLIIEGIDLDEEPKITTIMSNVNGNARPGQGEIVIGEKAAREQLGGKPGERLRVISPTFARTANGAVPVIRNALLAGTFKTGFPETDQLYGYMNMDAARALLMVPDGEVDLVHVMLHDPNKVADVKRQIEEKVGLVLQTPVYVTTWQDRNPVLFNALTLEKWAMFLILLLIVLVAAFNIIGTLVMVVMEKTREVGILKSMGAREASILRIFLYQGMIIGGVGTALGASLGLTVCLLLRYVVKIDVFSEAYLTDRIPILINPWMDVLIVISSLAICLFAALYPARQAAKLDPVEALRYE